nr:MULTISPECIES: 6-hydroxymethylpterin diphosphokinase MptE-like protein [unclassified Shimia]
MLRGRHKGQRAVIIGNGPSLLIKDLERLGNDITFASNKIFLAYGETKWRPTYYTVEDHLVLKNNFSEIYNLQDSTKLFPSNTRDSGYFAADTIFAPSLQPKSYETPLEDQNFPEFSTDLCRGIGWGSTVVYSQIQMALHMGCREIILIGIDHNYELPTKSDGKVFVGEGEQNHFHPDYRQPGEKWHPPNLDVLEVSYRKARKVCESRGVLIVNASRQTQLEVFQRADFDNIFPR